MKAAALQPDLAEFLAQYQAAFSDLDARRVSEFYMPPCLSISSTEVISYPGPSDLLENFVRVVRQFTGAGVSRFEHDVYKVEHHNEKLVSLHLQWRIYAGAQLLEQLNNVYLLRRNQGVWRVATVILCDN